MTQRPKFCDARRDATRNKPQRRTPPLNRAGTQRFKGFSHWVTRGHFLALTSKIITLDAMLNFDADVKKRSCVTNG